MKEDTKNRSAEQDILPEISVWVENLTEGLPIYSKSKISNISTRSMKKELGGENNCTAEKGISASPISFRPQGKAAMAG